MIGRQREVEFFAGSGDDVEICQGRFDHYYVGALVDVKFDFLDRFAPVGAVHLIRFTVAELRRRLGGVAERAVECGRVLGRVCHYWNRCKSVAVKGVPDCFYPAVHHVRRGDHIGPGPGKRERRFGEELEGLVVFYIVVLDDSAMTVVGVFTEADVGDQHQFRHRFLYCPKRLLDDAVVGVCFGTDRIFFLGDAEEDDRRDAEGLDFFTFLDDTVDGHLVVAGHGDDFVFYILAVPDKERVDQVVDGDLCFADHPPDCFVFSQSSFSVKREPHRFILSVRFPRR